MKKKSLMRSRVLSFLFLGWFAPMCFAGSQAMTWDDCVQEAKKNHPDLVSAREALNQVKADKGLVRSTALPQLNVNVGADTGKTSGKSRSETYSYGVSGRQLLFDGFKTSNDLAAVQERINSAAYDYQVVSSNVWYSLWTAFVGLLSAQESLGVTKDILERRRQNLDLVTMQYQGGSQHKGSLLTAQANVDQAGFDHVQAERNVALYQRRLTKELGRTMFLPITVKGDLTVLDTDRTEPDFEKLVESTPFLKELTAKKELSRK